MRQEEVRHGKLKARGQATTWECAFSIGFCEGKWPPVTRSGGTMCVSPHACAQKLPSRASPAQDQLRGPTPPGG